MSEKIKPSLSKNIFSEIKKIASSREAKVSHLVTEALTDKIKKVKEDAFVSQINTIFGDPEVIKEQRKMANDIATSTNIEELPW